MTSDLSLLSGFARRVLLSLHVRDTYLHSGSWFLSGLDTTAEAASLLVFNIHVPYACRKGTRGGERTPIMMLIYIESL